MTESAPAGIGDARGQEMGPLSPRDVDDNEIRRNARFADWCGGCAWLAVVLYFAAAITALTGAKYHWPHATMFTWADCLWMGMFLFYIVLLSASDAQSGKMFVWPFVAAIMLMMVRQYWTLGYTVNPYIAFLEVLFVAVVAVAVFHLQRHLTAVMVGTTSRHIIFAVLVALGATTLLSLPGVSIRVQRELNTPKIIGINHFMSATLKEFIAVEHITNYQVLGETNPLAPRADRTDDKGNLAITFSAGDTPVVMPWAYAGFASPLIVRDEGGFGIITGGNCMGPLSTIKYSYQGTELWRYEPRESSHPHGVGILSQRRRIIVLWDFEPQLEPEVEVVGHLLHVISWDTGKRIAWFRVPAKANGLAIDDNEEYLYLLDSNIGTYRISRLALDDCYTGEGIDR